MRHSVIAVSMLGTALLALPAGAATDPEGTAQAVPQQSTAQTREQGWSAQCTSTARDAKPDCAATQRVVLAQTGQLLAGISIRVPAETRKPVMMLQAPLGLYLPPGMSLKVGDDKPVTVPLQTCDNNGCYAGQPLSDDFLKTLRKAESLTLGFKNLNRQDISITVSLEGFEEAFEKIE